MAEPTRTNKFTSDFRGEPTPMPQLLERGQPNHPPPHRPPPPPVYTFENPPPRTRYQPEPVPGEEPGFYIVERSQSPAALEPLSPQEADFMMKYAGEIAAFTGETSTWLGVSAAVMEAHLAKLDDILKKIEKHHQDSFRQYGHLNSPEFFTQRRELLKELDAQLLNSKRVRGLTTFNDQGTLKNALGISSRSLVHHWKRAGVDGGIPGYASHVRAISRATTWMKAGGFIGIGIGGVSGLVAIQEVCQAGNEEACRKIKFVEGGKFLGSSGIGFAGGTAGASVATPVCLAIGVPTAGIGSVACAVAVVGVAAFVGTLSGGWPGELGGELLYESEWL